MATGIARYFHWHRWLGWLVGVQVLAWVVGGVLFAWLPFKPWVKGEADVAKPVAQALPADWAARAGQFLAGASGSAAQPVLAVSTVATAGGTALKLRHKEGSTWLSATGGPLQAPTAQSIEAFARSLYRGQGRAVQVSQVAQAPTRLGLVREMGERKNLWCAQFDDALKTRLYFDAQAGELLAVRNEAWVWYDLLWRLHVMDYSEGEDFNHPLIKAASALALGLIGTGAVLSGAAAWRRWRRSPSRRSS